MITVTDSQIKDVKMIEPAVFEDSRGYFLEAFNARDFREKGIDCTFVQDNEAYSQRGVLRGLHYQVGDHAQAKLVRVLRGAAYDVVVDLRPSSPTFKQWVSVELTAANKLQLFVPRGFAHGYLTLQDHTVLMYKCDNFYARDYEGGMRYDDPEIGITWPQLDIPYIVSEKDRNLPPFDQRRTA